MSRGEQEDLLDLLAMPHLVGVDTEWRVFVAALADVSLKDAADLIRPNALRPLLRDKIKPNRIGAFTHRARVEGYIAFTGDYQISDDLEGRNSGRPMRIYRWLGRPDEAA